MPRLMRSFEFELKEKNKAWGTQNAWFVKPTDFWVNVKKRIL